uniref:Uncharacterized protein n=1 Tax=Anguilla anguilla TaxID=7936 RepID=A0A0E9TGA8_ANGAN
MVETLCPEF